jgi:putative restriction endonuclease
VLQAYDETCAVTGWKLINGGGRGSLVCALKRRAPGIRPAWLRAIRRGGRSALRSAGREPFSCHAARSVGIMVSRQVNDRSSIDAMINKTGRALAPERLALRPHPAFLAWHREHCFKQ